MFASATSGDRPNNSKFSKCSIGNISNVLDAIEDKKKKNCFTGVLYAVNIFRNVTRVIRGFYCSIYFFVTASAGAFCGNKIVEAGEECDCGYDDNECVDKCCYPRQISDLDKMKNDTAKGCTRKSGTQCRYGSMQVGESDCESDVSFLFYSPSQGPCCSSESCQFVPLSKNVQCKAESDCSYNSTCNGRSSECPPPLPRANKTRCNEGTQVKKEYYFLYYRWGSSFIFLFSFSPFLFFLFTTI